MPSKPRCPECGGNVGVLVHYSTSRIFAAVPDGHGAWRRGKRVLRAAYPPEVSDSADQNLACVDCPWIGEDACIPRPKGRDA